MYGDGKKQFLFVLSTDKKRCLHNKSANFRPKSFIYCILDYICQRWRICGRKLWMTKHKVGINPILKSTFVAKTHRKGWWCFFDELLFSFKHSRYVI